jgi:aminopeptidase N
MTDRMGALTALMRVSGPVRQQALNRFESDYAQEPLVMDKWFSIQASAHRLPDDPAVLTQVLTLLRHPAFSIRNPNKVRALITTFCTQNLAEFHAPDGSGHVFWADQVLALDAINPQVAARLARALDRWRRYTPELQHSMQQSLHRVSGHAGLSRDVAEIVSKALADPA